MNLRFYSLKLNFRYPPTMFCCLKILGNKNTNKITAYSYSYD